MVDVALRTIQKRRKVGGLKPSAREAKILGPLCHGFTKKAIAQQLDISPHTMRDHIGAMSNWFHVTGRTGLVTIYFYKTAARMLASAQHELDGGYHPSVPKVKSTPHHPMLMR